ncbi:unnamed protein product [Prorocentrum cordatum]|uniref:Reverse transcriptase domain-containing protein n=1 Tax=Prorocentrum cordatum TaxID=2364126 RepID=A0ABN9T8D5_9DINO|nr:unnamed protein product [Polarella glacialis]
MDDTTSHFVGSADADASDLQTAARDFSECVFALGLRVEPSKSGVIFNRGRFQKRFADKARSLGLLPRKCIRNLGHDLVGPRIRREQADSRISALQARRRRLRILQKGAGRKVAHLWSTGLSPSVLHGAWVSGVDDGRLRLLRNSAAVLAGWSTGGGVTTYLASQANARYDPIFEASVPLVLRYAAWLWDNRVPPARLQRAWLALEADMLERPSWFLAKGPIAATWLSLRLLGWDMVSSTQIRSDIGTVFSLLQVCPEDLRHHLFLGIQRWQGARVAQHVHLPLSDGRSWMRGLRLGLRDLPARQLGAIQTLWSGRYVTPERRMALEGVGDPKCRACGAAEGTYGHPARRPACRARDLRRDAGDEAAAGRPRSRGELGVH